VEISHLDPHPTMNILFLVLSAALPARVSHRISTAAAAPGMPTALRSIGRRLATKYASKMTSKSG
jgi:hypothetical protein